MKRGPISIFSEEEQKQIKKRIWDGEIQRVVAEDVGLHPSTMKSIVAGYMWPDTLWPDGSRGPLSERQRRTISLTRHANTGQKTRHYGSAIARRHSDDRHEEDYWITEAARGVYRSQGINAPTDEQIAEMVKKIKERKGSK